MGNNFAYQPDFHHLYQAYQREKIQHPLFGNLTILRSKEKNEVLIEKVLRLRSNEKEFTSLLKDYAQFQVPQLAQMKLFHESSSSQNVCFDDGYYFSFICAFTNQDLHKVLQKTTVINQHQPFLIE